MSFGYSVLGFGGYPNRTSFSNFGGRGVFAGSGGSPSVIDYVTIAINGNATDFGDMSAGNGNKGAACSNGSRGVMTQSGDATMQYITVSTTGNSADFGELTVNRANGADATSNHLDRGVWMGGYFYNSSSGANETSNVIDYITISTTGNATDFGDLNVESWGGAAGCSTTSGRAFLGIGNDGSTDNVVDSISYFNTLALGNASDFGNLSYVTEYASAMADSTRGIIASGVQDNNVTNQLSMEYITIANTGNATDFGDTIGARTYRTGSCGNNIRGLIAGGYNYGTSSGWATIDLNIIQTTGNATDFGDLTVGRQVGGGLSGD